MESTGRWKPWTTQYWVEKMDWPWAQQTVLQKHTVGWIKYSVQTVLVSEKAPWQFGKTSGSICSGKDAVELFPLKDGFKSVPELQITFRRLISLNPSTSQLIQAQRAHFFFFIYSHHPSTVWIFHACYCLCSVQPNVHAKSTVSLFPFSTILSCLTSASLFSLPLIVTDHKSPRISQAFSLWHKNMITSA